MRKLLIATALIVAYATPAFAEDFYVAVDLASGRCVMMSGKEPRREALQDDGQVRLDGRGAQGHGHDARVPLVVDWRALATRRAPRRWQASTGEPV